MSVRSPCSKLSFVMPVALNEALTDKSLWRDQVNRDSVARLTLVLQSFVRMYQQDDLGDFFIVCPDAQCTVVRQVVTSVTVDPRYVVVPETSVVPSIGNVISADVDGLGGWYAQQVVKLAAHALVQTPYYFVFDSDIVCIRPCDYASFVIDDRPIANVESERDYVDLYVASFTEEEVRLKKERRIFSLATLGFDFAEVNCHVFYGETPVILSKAHVPLVLKHLEDVHGMDWVSVLCSRGGWTEFGLYFGYLDACNMTSSIYRLVDSNTVLDLRRSIWQLNSRYREARHYDQEHFFCATSGYFVALQSWIPESEWLPIQFESVRAFYEAMMRWLDAVPKPNVLR
jgi:hypothetical protein